MSEEIVVGDWVVAGKTRETREVGRIVSLDGDMAYVAWDGGHRTTCDLSGDDVEVYGRREDAAKREAQLDAAEPV